MNEQVYHVNYTYSTFSIGRYLMSSNSDTVTRASFLNRRNLLKHVLHTLSDIGA